MNKGIKILRNAIIEIAVLLDNFITDIKKY